MLSFARPFKIATSRLDRRNGLRYNWDGVDVSHLVYGKEMVQSVRQGQRYCGRQVLPPFKLQEVLPRYTSCHVCGIGYTHKNSCIISIVRTVFVTASMVRKRTCCRVYSQLWSRYHTKLKQINEILFRYATAKYMYAACFVLLHGSDGVACPRSTVIDLQHVTSSVNQPKPQ